MIQIHVAVASAWQFSSDADLWSNVRHQKQAARPDCRVPHYSNRAASRFLGGLLRSHLESRVGIDSEWSATVTMHFMQNLELMN